jgi:hypothetical protein
MLGWDRARELGLSQPALMIATELMCNACECKAEDGFFSRWPRASCRLCGAVWRATAPRCASPTRRARCVRWCGGLHNAPSQQTRRDAHCAIRHLHLQVMPYKAHRIEPPSNVVETSIGELTKM